MSRKFNEASEDIESILEDIREKASNSGFRADQLSMQNDDTPLEPDGSGAAKFERKDLPLILIDGARGKPRARSRPGSLTTTLRSVDVRREQRDVGDIEAERPIANALSSLSRPSLGPEERQKIAEAYFPKAAQNANMERRVSAADRPEAVKEDRDVAGELDANGRVHAGTSESPPSGEVSNAQAVASSASSHPAGVKRQMPSFLDTRMCRMTEKPSESDAPTEKIETASVEMAQENETQRKNEVHAEEVRSGVGDVSETSNPHEAAAELLRPLLKDWVGENMPHILEKALELESPHMTKKDKKS